MGRGRLVISTLVAAAAAVLLVAGGSAGTSNYTFVVAGGPPTLSAGAGGFVVAKFQPEKGSGAASHTVITFTFPQSSVPAPPTPDTDSSPDCGSAVSKGGNWIVTCNVGTVTPGQLVKRFVTFRAGDSPGPTGISAGVGFDNGSQKSKGGGAANGPSTVAGITIGTGNVAGTCDPEGGSVTAETPVQQTTLAFGTTSEPIPCSWGTVSVIDSGRDGHHAPKISSVGGVLYDTPSQITLTFDGSPVTLQENKVDPGIEADWTNVPNCLTDPPRLPSGADACIVGDPTTTGTGEDTCDNDEDDTQCVTTYTLLYRGSAAGPAGGTDPWFN